jgi:hypothetical protein
MQVLNRILDRRSRSVWIRLSGGSWRNRLWLAALTLTTLACVSLVIDLTTPNEPNGDSIDPESSNSTAFEAVEPATIASLPAEVARTPVEVPAPVANPVDQLRDDRGVRTASYETTQARPPRGAWLTGTIF